MARSRTGDSGVAMVELALLLPILFTILLGIVGFGYAYNQKVSLQAAVREGARELALRHDPADAEAAVRNAAPSIVEGSLSIDAMVECPASGDGNAEIRASALYDFPLPFFPFFDGKTLKAKAVMRCGL